MLAGLCGSGRLPAICLSACHLPVCLPSVCLPRSFAGKHPPSGTVLPDVSSGESGGLAQKCRPELEAALSGVCTVKTVPSAPGIPGQLGEPPVRPFPPASTSSRMILRALWGSSIMGL